MNLHPHLPRPLRRALYAGSEHACPVCGALIRRFVAGGHRRQRPACACPVCDSLERHRFGWRVLLSQHLPTTRVLHFAPEPTIGPLLRERAGAGYLSVDITPGRAMQVADITDLPFDDATFDLIWCSHVLEHIPNDARAMRELYRVLQPGGTAVVMVPLQRETTVEDPDERDPAERLRRFGQEDHVRVYGPDIAGRLAAAGFDVAVHRAADLGHTVVHREGLGDETVFLARRRT